MKKANLARAVPLRPALAFGKFDDKFLPKFTGVNLTNAGAKFDDKFEIFLENVVKFAKLNFAGGFVKLGLNLMNIQGLVIAPIRFVSSNLRRNKYISALKSEPNLTNSASRKFNQITATASKSNKNLGAEFSAAKTFANKFLAAEFAANKNSTAKIFATKFYAAALNEAIKFITAKPKRKSN